MYGENQRIDENEKLHSTIHSKKIYFKNSKAAIAKWLTKNKGKAN